MQEDKYKNKSCWWWRDTPTAASKARRECKNCSSKKCNRRMRYIEKDSRKTINREAIIEQVNERLHSSATPKEVFDVSNIILKTNFSVEEHRLVSRL